MKQKRNLFMIVLVVALASLVYTATNSYAQNEKYRAKLDGNNEVTTLKTTYKGVINLKKKNDMLTWKMNLTGISGLTGAHIHQGQAGENGKPVVDLLKVSKQKDTANVILMRGNVTDSSLTGPMAGQTIADLKTAMANGNAYVDVATASHPDGEIRGQIKMKGDNSTATANTTSLTITTP